MSTTKTDPTFSPHQGSLGFNFTFFNRLTLDAFFVGEAGAILSPELVRDMSNWEQWEPCYEELALIEAGDISTLTAKNIARCSPDYTGRENWASRNDYINLQSVTLGLQVPTSWIESLPISSALVQVQARNLFTITHFPGGQPRALMNTLTQIDRAAGWVVPAPTNINFNVRLNF